MKKVLEQFGVEYLQILKEDGSIDEHLMPKLTSKQIKEMYKAMVLARIFDNKLLALQRQGSVGTIAQSTGQEASAVGSAFALEKNDFIFPSFRESGALLYRGLPMDNIIRVFGWDERGAKAENVNAFTMSIPVATHLLHAVGYGMACNIKNDKKVIMAYFGDGATSEGDFHEAMNFAGVFNAPVVFICQNNQFAISVPREKQSKSKTIAQKAIAFGFKFIQMDGNDVFAVYSATKDAIDNARKGKGPTLIECFTYRIADHTTSDDSSKYRSEDEVNEWRKKDPIDRLIKYMEKKKLWNNKEEENLKKTCQDQVNKAAEKAMSLPNPNTGDIFRFMYKEMPKELQEQLDELEESLKYET